MPKPFRILFCLTLLTQCALAQTGISVPELAGIDRNIEAVRRKYGLPGAAVAVSYRGRLVYARGFGQADPRTGRAVQPDTLFRIASVSKPFTGVALLKLQEAGKLRLDDRVFDLLTEFRPLLGDPRMASITVRQLLQHTAGWDTEASGDPLFPDHATLSALGADFPPTLDETLAFWLAQPLDFAPGTRHAYSNFGYALAGRVIERVSGMTYGEAVRALVLEPLGISRMRLGRTMAAAPGEARYASLSASAPVLSVFSEEPTPVAAAYGGYSMENLAANGGWLASAPDLVRLLTAVDGSRAPALLTAESYRQLIARPIGISASSSWYGLGFQVLPSGGDHALTHDGALSDTCFALVARGLDGTTFAFVSNAMYSDAQAGRLQELELAVLEAIAGVTSQTRGWPAGDQFPAANPAPAVTAATNAATFQNGAVAPGQIVTLFGERLAPSAGVAGQLAGGRFPTESASVSVWFDDTPAPLLYASGGQINLVAPFNLAGKDQVSVTVVRDGVWSAPVNLPVVPAAPGIFNSRGAALALNQDGSLNSAAAPASRGSVLQLFATGTGAFQTEVTDGGLGTGGERLAQQLSVSIGGVAARVVYAGTSPGLTNGLTQINVEVPDSLGSGAQPVVVTAGGVSSPSGVAVMIR